MNRFKNLGKHVSEKLYYSHANNEEMNVKTLSESSYQTKGENLILVKDVNSCNLVLDSTTTTHIIIKALTSVNIKPLSGSIDEYFTEIELDRGACVEFYNVNDSWYILSSDGLKLN